ncbi:zinc finger CCCH domain-containing protein 11A [Pyxicephalus adspersus]|uniref:C3H1-type domain-containing protein n=1 Tax=Pyxicephalus adspersus TaxID=30357 RepID=A0AAV3BA10_PYXAD|nr:TPA: hypothetical protein GDO54_001534 [Pyxicephalus adspersus]
MSNQGDDCYFFFYSSCTKGDSCPFRHCKAALGNETVCTLWQEGRCFRQICKFRHMEIDKKRSAIPCFWENQVSGCQKGNCAFHHTKGRYVDGVYIPPSKTQIPKPEPTEIDPQVSQTASKLTTASTTHIHAVKIIEAADNVPSPTHPPVVINAADDDEDDDDQISEEGDELKPSGQPGGHQGARHATTRKMGILNKDPNVGIKTLNDIKSNRKKVQEESKDGAIPPLNVQEQNPANTEKSVTVVRTVMFSKNDSPSVHRSLAQRLGKRKVFCQDNPLGGESFPAVKKTLSERLGNMESPIVCSDGHPEKSEGFIAVKKTLSERLGKKLESSNIGPDGQLKNKRAANPTTDFHIKTLQEIRQEKDSQRREQEAKQLSMKNTDSFCFKSHVLIRPQSEIHVKSLHEIQAEKRLRQQKDEAHKIKDRVGKTECSVSEDLQTSQNCQDKNLIIPGKKQSTQVGIVWSHLCDKGNKSLHFTEDSPSSVDTKKSLSVGLKVMKAVSQPLQQVQIKTLEEIRKEKALRLKHSCQATNTEDLDCAYQPKDKSNQKRILRLSKPQVIKKTDQGISDSKFETNNSTTAEDTKTTMNILPPASAPEKVDSDKTWETQSLNSKDSTDTQKIAQAVGCSVEPNKILLGKKLKGKPKVHVEPNVIKRQSTAKAVLKRKAQQSSQVAEVKPLNTTVASTDEEKITTLLPVAEPPVSQNAAMISTSPKIMKERFQVPASDPGFSETTQTVVKSRRSSIASLGKPSVLAEDDFDELIWDISDGKLEDEIDLDPSKDEDDLLMELSEMIDS